MIVLVFLVLFILVGLIAWITQPRCGDCRAMMSRRARTCPNCGKRTGRL